MTNDLALVRRVVGELHDAGIHALVMGGWAEELHGVSPPRPHADIDLLLLDADESLLDTFIRRHDEIVGKRFQHKRAVEVDDVMVELFLAESAEGRYVTNFWGRYRWEWPEVLGPVVRHGLPMASEAALSSYRSDWDEIRTFAG